MIMVNECKRTDVQIYDILKELGVSPDLKGYHYTFWLIQNIVDGKLGSADKLTYLYAIAGKHFGTTASAVERAIRHMVERLFILTPMEIMYKYFGNIISYEKGKVTNGQFIALISEHIRIYRIAE